MNTTSTLSIATLVFAGLLATGCSQQQVDGGTSQVAGSTQQVAGTSQTATQTASQQQAEAPVEAAPAPVEAAPAPAPAPAPVRAADPWLHTHPAVPNCTNSVTHSHKYTNRNHTHKYGCKGRTARKGSVDVYSLQRKLKAKGYYKGPINGVVTPETRSALQRYMQNR